MDHKTKRGGGTEGEAMTLGERIKERRIGSGMSQEKLAELLDVSRQAVTKWEAGQSAPSSDNLFRLAEVLGCLVSELLDGGPEMGATPAEELYRKFRIEELEADLAKQKRRWRNLRNAGLVLLAYLVFLLAEVVLSGHGQTLLLVWIEPVDLWNVIADWQNFTYPFNWLLSQGLFAYCMILSAAPALFGKWRFSAVTAAAFMAGALLGKWLGDFPNPYGYHYGWIIWLVPFLWSIVMGIVLEVLTRKGVKLKSKRFLIWLGVFLAGYAALVILCLPPGG